METIALIVGLYLVATFLAVKYFIPIKFDQVKFRPKALLGILVLLLWPLWLPLAIYDKWQSYCTKWRSNRAKPVYLSTLAEFSQLIERGNELTRSVDALIEQLSTETNKSVVAALSEKLAALVEERHGVHTFALPEAKNRADAIYSRNYKFFSIDEVLPKVPLWHPFNNRRLERLLDDGRVSRLWLSVDLDEGGVSARSAASVAGRLEEHFGGLWAPLRDEVHILPDEALQSNEWTLVFSSGFKKSIRHVDKVLRQKTSKAVAELMADPMAARGDTITRLSHNKHGLWRYRLGDYRLIYMPLPKEHELVFVKLAHRNEVYL